MQTKQKLLTKVLSLFKSSGQVEADIIDDFSIMAIATKI